MTFLHAWAFGFLGVVPVIVLLYLLKIKRRAAPVSTLLFWQRVLVENRRRALFHRLRQLLSLLFHLLIFALILLALARPELARFVRSGVSTVLIVDTRARMQAVEANGESRFAKARRAADDYVRHASTQNVMALITCDADAKVAAPFCDDEKTLHETIAKLAPTDAAGNLDSALKLAHELLASRSGEKRLVVFTDSQSAIGNQQSAMKVVSVGSPRDNVAITRFAARRLFNSPQTSQVLLEVRNFGAKPARGNVELYYDDALVDVKPLDLAPGANRTEIFPTLPRAGRGQLRARLDVKDALSVDNEAFAVIPQQNKIRVLLVTRGNWFIEKMLAADDSVAFELLAPDAFKLEAAPNFEAVIFDNALPENFDLEKTKGNFLFVKQTPYKVLGELAQPLVSETDPQSPLLRLVALQNVTFLRSNKIETGENSAWKISTPLRSFDSPLIVTAERGNQRTAAFAFDVAESDLPLRVAFPLLMSNTLHWLADETNPPSQSLHAGETLALAPGEIVTTNDANFSATFQPLKNGWYALHHNGTESLIAVNTFDENESNLRATNAAQPSIHTPSVRLAALANQPLWMQLALAAFALFTLEWWLYHTRRTE